MINPGKLFLEETLYVDVDTLYHKSKQYLTH